MLKKQRPATLEDYLELVNQALFEVEELRLSAEYDDEGMANMCGFIDVLEKPLLELRKALEEGSYEFADEDLSFMGAINAQRLEVLPFRGMLRMINETHRKGLETGEA